MATDPSNLYRHMPDCYSRSSQSDTYKLLAAWQKVLNDAQARVTDAKEDITVSTSDGEGLDRLGSNFSTPRSPGQLDDHYRVLVGLIASMRRGTVAALKVVIEAATGQTWTVEDTQLNGAIPLGEVHFSPPANTHNPSAPALWPTLAANTGEDPEESAIAGTVHDALGVEGARLNDHAYSNVGDDTKALLNRIKLAGVTLVFH